MFEVHAAATSSDFQLSRVYAQGWNAANKLPMNERADFDSGQLAAANPYTAEPEKSRWLEGFTKALAK